MADERLVHGKEETRSNEETTTNEEETNESLEELEKTILVLCSGVNENQELMDSTKTNHHELKKERSGFSCILSPIKRQRQDVAVVTPLHHTSIGQAQSTPNTDGAYCPLFRCRELIYPSGPDLEISIKDEDNFLTLDDVYEDDMTYEQLLAEVSRISGASGNLESSKTAVSKIQLRDIVKAQENLDLSNSIHEVVSLDDIHDGKYFSMSCTSDVSAGRFTGVQKSRHVFDESSVAEETIPSADILGLEKFVCSDMDDEEEDEEDSFSDGSDGSYDSDENDGSVDRTRTNVNTDCLPANTLVFDPQNEFVNTLADVTIKSLAKCESAVTDLCSGKVQSPREPGELSSTATEYETETETPAATVVRKRKRKHSRVMESEREEGELSSTTDDADTGEDNDSEVETEKEDDVTLVESETDISVNEEQTSSVSSSASQHTALYQGQRVISDTASQSGQIPSLMSDVDVDEAGSVVTKEPAVCLGQSVTLERRPLQVSALTSDMPPSVPVIAKMTAECTDKKEKSYLGTTVGIVDYSLGTSDEETISNTTIEEDLIISSTSASIKRADLNEKGSKNEAENHRSSEDQCVLSLGEDEEDEEDVKKVLSGSSKEDVTQNTQKGHDSMENLLIDDACDLRSQTDGLPDSFVVIASPGKIEEESFLVIDDLLQENHLNKSFVTPKGSELLRVEQIQSVRADKKDNVKLSLPEHVHDVSSYKAQLGRKAVTDKNIECQQPSKVTNLRTNRCLVRATKASGNEYDSENIYQQATGKENVPENLKVNSVKKTLEVVHESNIMKCVRQKWNSEGIQCPDENLTYCSWKKRNQKERHNGNTFSLEGSYRVPPLFRDNSFLNMDEKTLSCDSPKMKKRKTIDSRSGDTSAYLMTALQSQLSAIETEQTQLAMMMANQHEQRTKMMRKHHSQCYQALCIKQNLERRQFYQTYHGYVAQSYLEHRMLMLKQDHANQAEELRTISRDEMTNLLKTLHEEKEVQKRRFESLKEPKRQMIETFRQQSRSSRAQMDTVAPHATVELWKGPCRSNHGKKSLVEVCLPTDIASFMIREDELYDAHYVY